MNQSYLTSLELSKKLKEVGVKQQSMFVWYTNADNAHPLYLGEDGMRPMEAKTYSAFLSDELGKMLPLDDKFQGDTWLDFYRYHNGFGVQLETLNRDTSIQILHSVHATTEADARGQMLLYLITNGFLKI